MRQLPRDEAFHDRCATAIEYTDFRHRHGDRSLDCRLGPGEMRWHMISCFRETAAAAGLMARGFAVYLPTEGRPYVRHGRSLVPAEHLARDDVASDRVTIRQLAMFPGVLFICVRSIEEQRTRILSVPGVHDIVRLNETAVVVPDAAIDKIKTIEMQMLVEAGVVRFDPEEAGQRPSKQKSRRARKRERERGVRANGAAELPIRIMCLGDPDATEELVEAVGRAAIAKAPASHRRDLLYRAMGLLPPTDRNAAGPSAA